MHNFFAPTPHHSYTSEGSAFLFSAVAAANSCVNWDVLIAHFGEQKI